MSRVPKPASEQARKFETRRKVDMVMEWLEQQARIREATGVYGRTNIELVWEAGSVSRLKFVDEVIVEDLTEKERELLMRQETDKKC